MKKHDTWENLSKRVKCKRKTKCNSIKHCQKVQILHIRHKSWQVRCKDVKALAMIYIT